MNPIRKQLRRTLLAATALLVAPFTLAAQPAPLADATDNGDGSFTSAWFGTFTPQNAEGTWVIHAQHGLLYVDPGATNEQIFIWDANVGLWLFTSIELYPTLYAYGDVNAFLTFVDGVPGPLPLPRTFLTADGSVVQLPFQPYEDLVTRIVSQHETETLVTAVTAADLVGTLQGDGPFTVFAPTDGAFANLPDGVLDGLLGDIPALTDVLLYHVAPGNVFAGDLGLGFVELAAGAKIEGYLTMANGVDAKITVTGSGVMIDGANVGSTDIIASNGVIHRIDGVITPPGNIAEVATEAGIFGTLLTAVTEAGLVDPLVGDDPLTVFAPTDEAFAALPDGLLEDLLNDIPTLTQILLYHIVAGKVYEADVPLGADVPTLNAAGATLSVTADGMGGLDVNADTANPANIISTDVRARNGVIHVIDAVILPPSN